MAIIFFTDFVEDRLQSLKQLMSLKTSQDAKFNDLVINAVCTNPQPLLALELFKQYRKFVNFYETNQETIQAMRMYAADENDYVIVVDKNEQIFYSGNFSDGNL